MSTGHRKHSGNGHPNVWAFLTLATFPVVLIATDLLGLDGIWPFVYAILATLIVLALEGTVRGRLWPFEPHFAECLGHPDTPLRILLFPGGVLLILETSLIAIIAMDRRLDRAVLGLIARKECGAWGDASSSSLCRRLTKDERPPMAAQATDDGLAFAIRSRAAREWYPDATLATCAVRQAGAWTDGSAQRHLAYASCTSWSVDAEGNLAPSDTKASYVAVNVTDGTDGLPTVSGWSDNMNNPSWDAVMGTNAETARDRIRTSSLVSELNPMLQAESRTRAQELLNR